LEGEWKQRHGVGAARLWSPPDRLMRIWAEGGGTEARELGREGGERGEQLEEDQGGGSGIERGRRSRGREKEGEKE